MKRLFALPAKVIQVFKLFLRRYIFSRKSYEPYESGCAEGNIIDLGSTTARFRKLFQNGLGMQARTDYRRPLPMVMHGKNSADDIPVERDAKANLLSDA